MSDHSGAISTVPAVRLAVGIAGGDGGAVSHGDPRSTKPFTDTCNRGTDEKLIKC